MEKILFNIGVVLAVMAAISSIVGLNTSAGGIPADIHPVGAVGVGISSLAFLYASQCVPK